MAIAYKAIPLINDKNLNFKIIGGLTPPTNPEENTIWVNTNNRIPLWSFSGKEPINPILHQLWIQEKPSYSPYNFNGIKQNTIVLSPYALKQWNGSAWELKTGKLYSSDGIQDFDMYERLEYIETTGTQYIDTDITVFNQSAFSIEYIAAFTAINYSYNHLWGNVDGQENYQSWIYNDGRLAYKWGSSTAVRSSSVKVDTNRHVYKFDKNASAIKMLVDDVQKLTSTNSGTINSSIRLFTRNKSSYGKAKVYEIKVCVSGTLKYHLVPAKRIEDGVIGLKDILNNKFYINNGTETFIAGPQIGCC